MIPSFKKNSYSFEKNIYATIKNNHLLDKRDGVVVGVSGGADSIALLSVLSALPLALNLVAVYVDHGLRPQESPEEIQRINALCKSLQTTFIVKTVDVKSLAENEGRSTEDAARQLRYQALEEVRVEQKCTKIAVGHHGDDQVEEFFIRLFRGTGATGLSGMQLRYKKIIRPLLFESKATITTYLTKQGLAWSTDSSNLSRSYLRNRIRLDLLPRLENKYNPALRKTVLNTMDVLREEDAFLKSISEEKYQHCVTQHHKEDGVTISMQIEPFLSNHRALRRRIIDKICWDMQSRPAYTTHFDIDLFSKTAQNGKELHLSNGLRVLKTEAALLFTKPTLPNNNRGSEKATEPFSILVKKPDTYKIPGSSHYITLSVVTKDAAKSTIDSDSGLQIDLDKVYFPLIIRGMKPGEKFTPYKGVGSKKISRYFNAIKLDKRKRPSWPLLVWQDSIVAVIGHTIDHKYRVTSETEHVLQITLDY